MRLRWVMQSRSAAAERLLLLLSHSSDTARSCPAPQSELGLLVQDVWLEESLPLVQGAARVDVSSPLPRLQVSYYFPVSDLVIQ